MRLQDFPKEKMLAWAAAHFDTLVYLDSNDYGHDAYGRYEALLAVGVCEELCVETGQTGAWLRSERFMQAQEGKWLFGALSYELKDELEPGRLHSPQPDRLGFPLLHLFVPQRVFILEKGTLHWRLEGEEVGVEIWADIAAWLQTEQFPTLPFALEASPSARLPQSDYLERVQAVLEHIAEGDVYELNLCQEFYAEEVQLDAPAALFQRLNALSPAPFAAYYRRAEAHLLCASPERFLCKRGGRLISQPIKGTARRGTTPQEDERLRLALRQDPKERAENVMIVDLVRNDLARQCLPGSIAVEELFGTYAFAQVWQLISTVSGTLRPDALPWAALQAAFPPGSMTGAPKVMAMQLAERYEPSRRGWYSGAVGYMAPDGDFDWNVVIRSLLYNARRQYLSFQVGGAIVYDSQPQAEYQECLLKAKALLHALGILYGI